MEKYPIGLKFAPKIIPGGIFEMDLQDKTCLLMEVLKSTKQDLCLEDSLRKRGSIICSSSKVHFHHNHNGTCLHDEMGLVTT